MAITYHLQYEEIGVSTTLIEDIIATEYTLTSLTPGADHRVRYRIVDIDSGVKTWSVWSAWVTFQTQALALPVDLNAGTIVTSSTQHTATIEFTVPDVIITTYDVKVTETGQSPVVITGITESQYTLTGLTPNAEHSVSIREVNTYNGVKTWSVWSAPTVFNTLVASTPVDLNSGTVVSVSTKHPATIEITTPDVIVTSYDLEITETGQSPVVITGITESQYTLTGLTTSTEHSVKIREVNTYNGVKTWSVWSAPTVFNTLAVTSPVDINAGSIISSSTLHAPSVTIAQPELPVDLNAGSISSSSVLYTHTLENDNSFIYVPAIAWDIEVKNVYTDTIVLSTSTNVSEYQITGLSPATLHSVRVRGKNSGTLSDWTPEVQFISNGEPVHLNTTESIEQSLDQFYIKIDSSVLNTSNNVTDFFGTISTGDINGNIEVTFEGQTLPAKLLGDEWHISMIGDRLGLAQQDELTRNYALVMSGDMQLTGNDGFLITGLTI